MSRRGADKRSVGVSLSVTCSWFSTFVWSWTHLAHFIWMTFPSQKGHSCLTFASWVKNTPWALCGLNPTIPYHTTPSFSFSSASSCLNSHNYSFFHCDNLQHCSHPCCPFVQLIYSTTRTSLALIVWVTIAQCVIKHFLALNKRQQLEKVMECG